MSHALTTCIRCGRQRWGGLGRVCFSCRDAHAEDIRQAAVELTTAYLEDPAVTLDELKPQFLTLIEALDGLPPPAGDRSAAGISATPTSLGGGA